jgi:hypothetical protein
MVEVPAGTYDRAFHVATEVARKEGLGAEFLDRRGGVIETSPERAATILEPWRTDNASLGQAIENTVSFQRRRARFEFIPAGFVPPSVPPTGEALPIPPVVAESTLPDLTEHAGAVELRVWVFLERAHTPNIRRFTWSRRFISYYSDPQADRQIAESGSPETYSIWTPVGRDLVAERRILNAIQNRLAETPPS